ncbi:MAG: hypothetical protein ACE1ZI_06525, partial [Acidobacteriota bacterium]
MRQSSLSSRGSSLVEMTMSTLLAGVVLLAGGALFRPALDISYLTAQQAAMQRSVRLAIDVISRELSLAGNGIPGGGIQLPSGAGSVDSKFACDLNSVCYVTSNVYTDERLYALTTGDAKGSVVNGITTDVVTVAYRDPNSNLDQFPLVSVTGNQITLNTSTSPAYDDPNTGVKGGDMLLLCNMHGCAAGVVTNVQINGVVDLGVGDPLNINQPTAEFGNISSILN